MQRRDSVARGKGETQEETSVAALALPGGHVPGMMTGRPKMKMLPCETMPANVA